MTGHHQRDGERELNSVGCPDLRICRQLREYIDKPPQCRKLFLPDLLPHRVAPGKILCPCPEPGANKEYNIDLEESGLSSGQVINIVTGISIFKITGPEGARNANALLALSKAIDDQGVDDAYTKLPFQLITPDSPPASTTVSQASTVPVQRQVDSWCFDQLVSVRY